MLIEAKVPQNLWNEVLPSSRQPTSSEAGFGRLTEIGASGTSDGGSPVWRLRQKIALPLSGFPMVVAALLARIHQNRGGMHLVDVRSYQLRPRVHVQ